MNKQKLIESIKKTELFKWFKQTFYQTKNNDYNQKILDDFSTDNYMKELLLDSKPCMISRLGSTELKILKAYHRKRAYGTNLRDIIKNLSGVFPTDDFHLDKFAKLYFEKVSDVDLLGIWFNPFEDTVANNYCINAKLTKLRSLEPYFASEPWSYYLKGKKVLVVHPFSGSIQSQFKKRTELFKNPKVLPDFQLMTYQAVQTLGGGNGEFNSWFEALEKMQNDISKIDFDIAIIGAGAYGLPLASFVKEMGKKSIHLGGATQMLFGVYGRRWETHTDFKDIINEHWIKPQLDEKPKNANNVENACYW